MSFKEYMNEELKTVEDYGKITKNTEYVVNSKGKSKLDTKRVRFTGRVANHSGNKMVEVRDNESKETTFVNPEYLMDTLTYHRIYHS